VKWGRGGCVQALIDAGFDVNASGGGRVSALAYCADVEIARILLDAGAEDILYDDGFTAASLACKDTRRIEVLRLLLQRFPNRDHPKKPLLFFAVEARNRDAVRALASVQPPEYMNKQDSRGRTALALTECSDMMQVLLKLGTDPRIVDNEGVSPLMHISNAACVRLLLEAAPDLISVRDLKGRTALMHLSCCDRRHDALKELLCYCKEHRLDACVNSKDITGDTALHIAMVARNIRAVKLLLKAGSDVICSGYEGTTALMKPFVDEDVVSSAHAGIPLNPYVRATAKRKDAESDVCLKALLNAVFLCGGSGESCVVAVTSHHNHRTRSSESSAPGTRCWCSRGDHSVIGKISAYAVAIIAFALGYPWYCRLHSGQQ
jgi:ankyrin repeat protein